ncbi:MAG TPA: hypothetical protein VE398_16735 [Acidobacteriota bacterium]|nr:hypothetical protein [Acidobacteriota bacterium]
MNKDFTVTRSSPDRTPVTMSLRLTATLLRRLMLLAVLVGFVGILLPSLVLADEETKTREPWAERSANTS